MYVSIIDDQEEPETYCGRYPTQNKRVMIVNLKTLKLENNDIYDDVLRSTCIYTSPSLQHVSDDFIATSSEKIVYLWDKYYGNLLKTLDFRERVIRVKFNPKDQDECITLSVSWSNMTSMWSCDNVKLYVWQSKANERSNGLYKQRLENLLKR